MQSVQRDPREQPANPVAPHPLLVKLPDLFDQVAALERRFAQVSAALVSMFPHKEAELTAPKSEAAEGG